MPRNRAGAQLAIQAPPELLERLRSAAAAQRRTLTALVLEAIEAALSGGLRAPALAGRYRPGYLRVLTVSPGVACLLQ